jgi:NAD+ synthase (glutamine-hydrolysing)
MGPRQTSFTYIDTRKTADINPIGAISKTDLKKFIVYAEGAFNLPVLHKYV